MWTGHRLTARALPGLHIGLAGLSAACGASQPPPPPLNNFSFDQIPPEIWAGIAFLWFALSIAYRRGMGRPLFASARPGATFAEGWASARAGTGLVARLGTGRNCMHVQVAGGALRIHPHFPFTLGFMPELYALDQVIPLEAIRSATSLGGNRAQAVGVRYLTPGGDDGTVLLLLRNAEPFIHAVLARRTDAVV